MSRRLPFPDLAVLVPALPQWVRRARLALDLSLRLGARPLAAWLRHRVALGLGQPHRRLTDTPRPNGPFLALLAWRLADLAPAPRLNDEDLARLGMVAAGAAAIPGHGEYDPAAHALDLDLFAQGDIRPVWEQNRLAALPLFVQRAHIEAAEAPLAQAEALIEDWCAANPPFRGPNWACAQEAGFRVLNCSLALALLDADRALTEGARRFLAVHAQRIAATRHYARAQDNNHPISEAAGLFVCGLLLRDAAMAHAAARDLSVSVARLVAPDGAFAQPSAQYHRLLLDTLALAEWFRRRHAAPPFAAPFQDRAAAATVWLHRIMDPETGALPRIGHCDDSALADLSACGPTDARGSVERATRLFRAASAGFAADAGCAWLGLETPDATLAATDRAWQSEGWGGWQADGSRALLRTGVPMRFRPAHCDLLHLDLFDGGSNLLRDGGTGAYNPAPDQAHWPAALWGTDGHNTIAFDGGEQMPRVGRFLLARWPHCWALEDGAGCRDHAGRTHERRVRVEGRVWTIEDRVDGPFSRLSMRWRLAPGAWQLTEDGAESPLGRIVIQADAEVAISLRSGIESLAYGQVSALPVLKVRATAPISRLVTTILLPTTLPPRRADAKAELHGEHRQVPQPA